MLLKRFTLLAGAAMIGLSPVKVLSQTEGEATSQPNDARLSRQFSDGFTKGCDSGKTPGVENQKGYCRCLVDSYLKRYDGRTLSVISQTAGKLGNGGPALVNLMMMPEAKACSAKF